jgi:hypothetical protein
MGERMKLSLVGAVCLVLSLPLLAACGVKTPEIRGVVLDEKTKEPVKDAWVNCSMDVITGTLAGDVHNSHTVAPPHLRTDDKGRFVIPRKKISTMWGFGTKVRAFGASAETIDERDGGIDLLPQINLRKAEVAIYVRPSKDTEQGKFSYLQALHKYCTTGRFSVEVPGKDIRCDEWELNYTITKHERYLQEFPEPKTSDQTSSHTMALKQLAYLYQQKGDYQRALDTFVKVYEFDKERDMDLWLKEYESQIRGLKQELKQQEQQ